MKKKRAQKWMLQLDMKRWKRLESCAKRRRLAAGGTVRPTAGDIVREMIDKHIPN